MPSCFYNANGTMIGGDPHKYLTILPPDPAPVTIFVPHFVFAAFDGECDDEKTRPVHVTSDGQPMLQKEFKRIRVAPHLPLTPAPPHPAEAMAFLLTVWFSGSAAVLAVATVTGAGEPLACCIGGCIGTNLNCCDPIDLPLNLVLNENSVLTQPTGADFARAVIDIAVNGLISLLIGGIFDKAAKSKLGKAIEKKLEKYLEPIRKQAEELAKEYLGKAEKHVEDFIKGRSRTMATLASLGVTHV